MDDGLPILSSADMMAAEHALFDTGIHPYALMQEAARGAAEYIWRIGHVRPTLVLVGPGNNGGDGYVIARILRDRGVPVRVAALGESKTESSRRARADWDGPIGDVFNCMPATQLVDCLFGIGLTRGLDNALADRLAYLVGEAQRSFAIDVPSGVDSDSGALLSAVPHFDICIAQGALKPAHLIAPASTRFDQLVCVPIGLRTDATHVRTLTRPDFEAPAPDAHKYTRGMVSIVAGAMAGASALAAEAAARSGAGYVQLVGAQAVVPTSHAIVRRTRRAANSLVDPRISALLIGPGLGRDDQARAWLGDALAAGHATVVDADGLMLMDKDSFVSLPPSSILTPHDGEFAHLFGMLPGNRIDQTRVAAQLCGAVVIRKGAVTVIAAPDGRVRVATGASSWLSTAGTGDVLAGICTARMAVTHGPFRAACEAVWLHGEAARRAGTAFAADDIIPHIPAAIRSRT